MDALGMCWKYETFRHELDPFAAIDPFKPPGAWFPQNIPKDEVYGEFTIQAQDFQDFNVHGFSHYLSHPEVHVPIIRTLCQGDQWVSAKEFDAALKVWRNKTLQKKIVDKFKEEFGDLVSKKPKDWTKILPKFIEYRTEAITLGIDPREGES
jgi:predicted glycoside hydrolase/deacetylase ChbG (UPF0249 family)